MISRVGLKDFFFPENSMKRERERDRETEREREKEREREGVREEEGWDLENQRSCMSILWCTGSFKSHANIAMQSPDNNAF